jgi:hypothetical protein
VGKQFERIGAAAGLSDSARAQYHWDLAKAQQQGKVKCFLVTSVLQTIPGSMDAGPTGGTITSGGTAANGSKGPPSK